MFELRYFFCVVEARMKRSCVSLFGDFGVFRVPTATTTPFGFKAQQWFSTLFVLPSRESLKSIKRYLGLFCDVTVFFEWEIESTEVLWNKKQRQWKKARVEFPTHSHEREIKTLSVECDQERNTIFLLCTLFFKARIFFISPLQMREKKRNKRFKKKKKPTRSGKMCCCCLEQQRHTPGFLLLFFFF